MEVQQASVQSRSSEAMSRARYYPVEGAPSYPGVGRICSADVSQGV